MQNEKIKVLVVDDNKGDYVLIQHMLQDVSRDGFEVTWAATFEEGVTAMVMACPDVFLIDYRLGGHQNGLDLLQVLIANECKAPAILLTGQADETVDLEASRLGADDYFEKAQLNGQILERAIRYAIQRKEMVLELRQVRDDLERKVDERTAHLTSVNQRLQLEIAGRKKAEEQIQQIQKLDAVGRVVSGVAHDFNNYLGVMQGYLEMVFNSPALEPTVRSHILRLLEAVGGASRLAHQLLMFSCQKPVEKKVIDLNERVEKLKKMLSRVLGEQVVVQLDLDDALWPVTADADNLDQVLMNLAVNARDAMPNGGDMHIETRNVSLEAADCEGRPQARAGHFLCLSVQDSGVGMQADVIARLFEPFFTTKAPDQGTGLGLSVVYGIVRAHDGWIEVKSELGKGSRFDVYLSADLENVLLSEKPEEPPQFYAGGKGECILVVEDDPAFGQMICNALVESGYKAVLCTTSQDATRRFREDQPDLVLSDMVLPDGRGVNLFQQFTKERQNLPTILMTGYPEEWAQREIIEQIGCVFLKKPMSLGVLMTHIETALKSA